MCGIKDLRGLADAGVYSLKIEGRMKQIPYAAGVVSYYRKYIDLFLSGQETQISEEDYRAVLAFETAVDLPTDITTGTMVLIW